METYILHFDGSCGPKNPGGTAAYGYALYHDDVEIDRDHAVVGTGPGMSNNLAEFEGAAAGMKAFFLNVVCDGMLEYGQYALDVRGDSQIVINILNQRWRPSEDKLYWPGYVKASRWRDGLSTRINSLTFNWVPREQNTICDDLSKAHWNQAA